jgi:hypothetical protein
MKLRRLMIAGALWLAGAIMAAHAQSPEETRATLPAQIREAFDSPYGKALVAELGKSLRSNADASCLTAKGITPDQFEQRGHDLVVKWGLRTMETANSFIDPKVYREKFTATAGRDAEDELARLRDDADVKHSMELERPIQQAETVDLFFEQFDRYVLVKQIKLMAISPLATGNSQLLEMNPTEAAERKLSQFAAENKSPALKKYLKLSQQSLVASTAATKMEDALKIGPDTFLAGMEADLAELCIGSKR